jgi:DNA-binding transcriptional regulator YiaG
LLALNGLETVRRGNSRFLKKAEETKFMPNLAATIKEEIRRLARKEIRAQMGTTRKAAASHRREIARLKRLLQAQEKKIARLASQARSSGERASGEEEALQGLRFSPRSVRAQRRRLKLSAQEFAKLVGVSAQTVYHWEQGKGRPRAAQFAALISVRGIGRREARSRLEDE